MPRGLHVAQGNRDALNEPDHEACCTKRISISGAFLYNLHDATEKKAYAFDTWSTMSAIQRETLQEWRKIYLSPPTT